MNTKTRPTSLPPPKRVRKDKILAPFLLGTFVDCSVLLSSNVSTARDMLANERNWLTWFRLSCTLIVLGFTLLLKIRFPDNSGSGRAIENRLQQPTGYIFVVIGLICFLVGLSKYFKNQNMLINQATYVRAGLGTYTTALALAAFACVVLYLEK